MDLAYDSAEEDAFRKAILAQTDAMIQEHNSDSESTYQMAHNQFSAMLNLHLFYNYVYKTMKLYYNLITFRPTRRRS